MIKKFNTGFTLVEVLIAVGVLSVVSFAFLPSFTGSIKEKSFQQSLDTVKDAVVTVRTKALTETGNPGLADAQRYNYAGIKFTNGSGQYVSFRSTEATSNVCINMPSGSIVIDSTKTLSGNVVARIPSAESPLCIFFEYQTGNAVTTKGSSNAVNCTN